LVRNGIPDWHILVLIFQWGLKNTTSDLIDNLYYTYNPNSNQLKNVIDIQNDPQTTLGDFRTPTTPAKTKL